MKPGSAIPSAAWKQRYETLRQHCLEEAAVLASAPLGLALLRRHGMAGWMRQWNETAGGAKVGSAAPASVERHPQLTHLLAQITLAHLFN